MEELVKKIVQENLEYKLEKKILLSDKLSDLEINSIVFIKIMVALEENFNCTIKDDDLVIEKYNTINDFVKCIKVTLALNEVKK